MVLGFDNCLEFVPPKQILRQLLVLKLFWQTVNILVFQFQISLKEIPHTYFCHRHIDLLLIVSKLRQDRTDFKMSYPNFNITIIEYLEIY